MKISAIASEIAHRRLVRLLMRCFKLHEGDADELTRTIGSLIDAKVAHKVAELEAERDETRRKFFALHPSLKAPPNVVVPP